MKKAKIVLAAVALFAVVGGAVAFKAARATEFVYTTGAIPNICDVTLRFVTTANTGGTPLGSLAVTTIKGAACVNQPIYLGQ